ncbi:methyltransferase [Streptomyces sp. NPDC004549]|uniref:methyltransferase n=1 Tax=Streptomyces sp. NPDC004549 TaxID=3154283 RepID=UPI0033BCFDE0
MPLTREQARNHQMTLDLVHTDRELTVKEREFVLDHYQPSASTTQALEGAYFTPREMAYQLAAYDIGGDRPGERVIDLGAGIGRLAFEVVHDPWRIHADVPLGEMICVERNPDYVHVGRRAVPEATWICGDLLDIPDMKLGVLDCAISNPPFGNIPRSRDTATYRPRQFEYHAIAAAAQVARRGVFIVPRPSVHGKDHSQRTADCLRFTRETGIELETTWMNADAWRDQWGGPTPSVTVVTADFHHLHQPTKIRA